MLESRVELEARLITEAVAAERQGKYLLDIALLFSEGPHRDDAIDQGNALILKASELRQRVQRRKV